MLPTLLDLALAPLLVAVSLLAARRWGARTAGLLSAFPAIVGPLLLITARQMGPAAAERAAEGTLFGLVGLSGFVLTYGRLAHHAGWRVSFTAGWAAAGLLGAIAGAGTHAGRVWAIVVASGSVLVSLAALPRSPSAIPSSARRTRIPRRAALTAAIVAVLAAMSRLVGPLAAGILAALPVLASTLAVFVHRDEGAGAVVPFLRGMMSGMFGFVAFCAAIVLFIEPAGTPVAFLTATAMALAAQLLGVWRPSAGRSFAGRTIV